MKKLIVLILFAVNFFACTEKNQPGNDLVKDLKIRIDSLQMVNDSLTQALTTIKKDSIIVREPMYNDYNLTRKGIENPSEFIEKSLRGRPELIPIKGVLGGTMRFTSIKPVGGNWVVAHYEDGHIAGSSIYKFRLNHKKELEFELLDSVEP